MLLAVVQVPTLKTNAMIAAWIERGIALLSFHAGTSFTKDFEMKQVKLGSEGLVVSAEGLGCMGMSAFYGPSDEQENLSTLARAIELGITFFDTAEIYGPFKNEVLLAKAFAGKRDKVLIATNVGSEVSDSGERGQVNGTPAYIKKAIDRSPCGTGTSARMAQLAAKGRLKVGDEFVHESIIGSLFNGRVEAAVKVANRDAIVPSIAGWARMTGINTIFIDDRDPYAHGFVVK